MHLFGFLRRIAWLWMHTARLLRVPSVNSEKGQNEIGEALLPSQSNNILIIITFSQHSMDGLSRVYSECERVLPITSNFNSIDASHSSLLFLLTRHCRLFVAAAAPATTAAAFLLICHRRFES